METILCSLSLFVIYWAKQQQHVNLKKVTKVFSINSQRYLLNLKIFFPGQFGGKNI